MDRRPPPSTEFDLDAPKLPAAIKKAALASGGYPYSENLDKDVYEDELRRLQIELVKLLGWQGDTGARAVLLFEGRDAAGKGGTIKAIREHLNPRHARIVALAKPSDREAGQWYFQRYAAEMPAAGEMVLFDRSWHNRGVVEPVMGFCTPEEAERFLAEAPDFERMLVRDGIRLFKFWLTIGREMQLKRFHDRRHDPLKAWKISPVDIAAIAKWDEFTAARDRMIAATHTEHAPWVVVRSNDKRRAHLALIRHVLRSVDYAGRDLGPIGEVDPRILGLGPEALSGR
ncbi:MAG: polyphosphate kinase 2 [Pseudomonadota bacterium]|nr:polyphosphate kinase 2 [Pseudomonadota bacterium]